MADPILPGGEAGLREALVSAGAYALALISANAPWKSAEPKQEWQRFSYSSAEAAAEAWSKGDPERARAEVVVAALLAGPLAQIQSDRTRLQEELDAVDLAFEGLEETDRARRIGHWIGLAAAETTRANAAEADRTRLEAENAALKLDRRRIDNRIRAQRSALRQLAEQSASVGSSAYASLYQFARKKAAEVRQARAALAQPQPEERGPLPLDPSPQGEGGGA